jgi:hypothetical protein
MAADDKMDTGAASAAAAAATEAAGNKKPPTPTVEGACDCVRLRLFVVCGLIDWLD